MSHTIKIRSKRHAAQIRKFVKRKGLRDETTRGAQWRVGVYVHIWFDAPRSYMAWSVNSLDGGDRLTSLRELYTKEPKFSYWV